MNTDKVINKVIKFIAVGLVLWAAVEYLVNDYEFFYPITVNTEPSPPTETFSQKVEPDS